MHPMWNEKVLIDAGCSPGVVAHGRAVSKFAAGLAQSISVIPIDIELVRLGGLLHDIGRSRTHGVGHAIAGVEIGRRLRFPQPLLDIIERHIGAGITADEAERLGLPRKDYLPLTPEEKIVSYADNLTKGESPMSFEDALERFCAILGADHEGIALFQSQHAEIRRWMK